MRRSTYGFCHGDRGALLTSRMPRECTRTVEPIAIAQPVAWAGVPGERLHDLLRPSTPPSGYQSSHVPVDHASPMVRQDDEDE